MKRKTLVLWILTILLCIGSAYAYRVLYSINVSMEIVDYQVRAFTLNNTLIEDLDLGKIQRNCFWDLGIYQLRHLGSEPVKISYKIEYLPDDIRHWLFIRLINETDYVRLEERQIWDRILYSNQTCIWYLRLHIPQVVEVGEYRYKLRFISNPVEG